MSIPSSDSAAIRQTIRALKASGYTPIVVDDGEEQHRVAGMSEGAVIELLMGVDASWLYVAPSKDSQDRSWLFFVMGNDPDEVINDYTLDLDPVIGALLDRWTD